MIDLDNFKAINDFNGHSVGDQILMECANRIRAQLPERGVLARLGGDEFAVIVPFDPHRRDGIDRFAASIIDAISRPVPCNGISIDVTVSVGIRARLPGRRSPAIRMPKR